MKKKCHIDNYGVILHIDNLGVNEGDANRNRLLDDNQGVALMN